MKNFRILLSTMAFLLAIGGAFASSLKPMVTGYIFVSGPIPSCQVSVDCTGSSSICQDSNGHTVYSTMTVSGTTCGAVLHHN